MFRPCIDLHEGKVKQIVGGTLDSATGDLKTNFISDRPAAWYADLYKRDQLKGGHVIMLGSGNDTQAAEALQAYRAGLQIGGGINIENAGMWLDRGASHVIVTSWVFRNGQVDWVRLRELSESIGTARLVVDLSCRKRNGVYMIVTDRWQKFTDVHLSGESMAEFANYCDEFLVHAVDVEGLSAGIDTDLISKLAIWSEIPVTYAGGAKSIDDLELCTKLSGGKVDLTIGSALDIFGGKSVRYSDAVEFNRRSMGMRSS